MSNASDTLLSRSRIWMLRARSASRKDTTSSKEMHIRAWPRSGSAIVRPQRAASTHCSAETTVCARRHHTRRTCATRRAATSCGVAHLLRSVLPKQPVGRHRSNEACVGVHGVDEIAEVGVQRALALAYQLTQFCAELFALQAHRTQDTGHSTQHTAHAHSIVRDHSPARAHMALRTAPQSPRRWRQQRWRKTRRLCVDWTAPAVAV
jgi:hypothetical protein